jgi:curved DNA-binding protein CbpA
LGVGKNASADEIRSAFRKIVLAHHPDRSNDPASKPIFFAATEAYEILSVSETRRRYDESIELEAKRRVADQVRQQQMKAGAAAARGHRAADPEPRTPPKPTERSVAEEIQRLTKLFSTGRHNEAEAHARAILRRDNRQAVPYAVLGDIARARGKNDEAAKMYAFAMQMDPHNGLYEQRYNDLLERSQVVTEKKRLRLEPEDRKVIAPMVGGAVVLMAGIYMALSDEGRIFSWLPPISSWTMGTLLSLFISGVTIGATLAIGGLLDRFDAVSTSSTGKVTPTMALGCVSVVQFWFAAALYACVGFAQRSWNYSTSRLVLAVGGSTVFLAFATCLNPHVHPAEVLVWGGNLIYIGSLCGWVVADALRQ